MPLESFIAQIRDPHTRRACARDDSCTTDYPTAEIPEMREEDERKMPERDNARQPLRRPSFAADSFT
jgi:hypothetical protein